MTDPETMSAPRETEALDRWPELRPFVREVVARYGDRLHAVLLYGSRARGEEREDSDYDLSVVFSAPFDHLDVSGDLSDSAWNLRFESAPATLGPAIEAFPLPLDLLIDPSAPYTRNVLADGIVLAGEPV